MQQYALSPCALGVSVYTLFMSNAHNATAAPIDHLSGWGTFDIVVTAGRKSLDLIRFAPDFATALRDAKRIASDWADERGVKTWSVYSCRER